MTIFLKKFVVKLSKEVKILESGQIKNDDELLVPSRKNSTFVIHIIRKTRELTSPVEVAKDGFG